MKKAIFIACAISFLVVSCKEKTNESVTTTEQETAVEKGSSYNVDEAESFVKWTGYHKGGLNPRFGIVKTTGSLSSENNEITGGTFTMDMNSVLTDEKSVDPAISDGKTASDLDVHLKNADFFDVAKYPTSTFSITSVKKLENPSVEATHTVSGNLKIKDKTVNVSFPAKVTETENQITLQSKFSINRLDWGLNYVAEGDPKDWVISKDIDLELNIKANKSK